MSPAVTPDRSDKPLGWWAISGEALLDMLRRAHAGDDPELVYLEEYANAGHEYPDGESQ